MSGPTPGLVGSSRRLLEISQRVPTSPPRAGHVSSPVNAASGSATSHCHRRLRGLTPAVVDAAAAATPAWRNG